MRIIKIWRNITIPFNIILIPSFIQNTLQTTVKSKNLWDNLTIPHVP